MAIRKGARLHSVHFRISEPEGLNVGDIVSVLPGLWHSFGLVCNFAEQKHILRLDAQASGDRGPNSTIHRLSDYNRTNFMVLPNAVIVPLLDHDTFDVRNPGLNGIGIAGDKILCVGWTNHSYVLIEAATGEAVDRQRYNPLYISSWDLMFRDADDDLVSLLEVRPDPDKAR